MASSGRIETLQRLIAARVGAVIENEVVIRPRDYGWKKATRDSRIAFDMFCEAFYSSAQRKRGGRCPVFPLKATAGPLEPQVWASWHEEWICEQKDQFDLVGVGWTFFWGLDGRLGENTEIVRAEWDYVKHRGGFAAQPHWHLDTQLMLEYSRPRPVSREDTIHELIELPILESPELVEYGASLDIHVVDISGMHLGMGGWEHDASHPNCWQHKLTIGLDELVLWAERALLSAKDQFEELDPVD